MNKQIFKMAAVILAVLILTSCNFSHKATKDYNNNTYSFNTQCSKDWNIKEGQMGSVVAFFSPLKNSKDKFSENVNISVEDMSINPITLEQYSDQALKQINDSVQNIKDVSDKAVQYLGLNAHEVTYSGTQDDLKLKWKMVYFIKDDTAFVITYCAEQSQYDNYLSDANIVYNSFYLK